MKFLPCLLKTSVLCVSFFLLVSSSNAQEKSVRPGINKKFENPDLKEIVEIFEGESREIFQKRREIVSACKIKPGVVVADIGACTGLFTRLFAKKVGPKGKVYAVDIAPEMIQYIEKNCKEAGIENVIGVLCDQRSTNLPPNSIDVAFICDTYHHFEFPFRTMSSLHKSVKPGGQVIVIDFHRIKGKSREWIMGLVRAGQDVFTREIQSCGFKQVEERNDLLEENYFLRFGKVSKE